MQMLTPGERAAAEQLSAYVKKALPPDPTGHDWPHVARVVKNAERIARHEGGNLYRITLLALTHDLYDHKFFNGTQEQAEENLQALLREQGVHEADVKATVENVFLISFSKSGSGKLSLEGKIVQDADRLEAIGAIGIARAFAYGGFKNRLMNHSGNHTGTTGTTFDHFFEKLLKLYDLLNTNTAKEIAKERFEFMQEFVKRFGSEWNV